MTEKTKPDHSLGCNCVECVPLSQAPTTKLSSLELNGLEEISKFHGSYVWKQATMKKLAARGFVASTRNCHGLPVWEILDAGREYLKGFPS